MCAAVTHYDRQENTILLDKSGMIHYGHPFSIHFSFPSGHIRATFIGDDESLDSYNIRVGHTLILRNVIPIANLSLLHSFPSGSSIHINSSSTSLREYSYSKYHCRSRSLD